MALILTQGAVFRVTNWAHVFCALFVACFRRFIAAVLNKNLDLTVMVDALSAGQ